VNNSAKTSFYIPEFLYMADINVYMFPLKYQSIRTKGEVLRIQLPLYKVVINPDLNSAKMTLPLSLLPAQHSFNRSKFFIDSIFRSSSTQLWILLWERIITADEIEAPKVYKVPVKYCRTIRKAKQEGKMEPGTTKMQIIRRMESPEPRTEAQVVANGGRYSSLVLATYRYLSLLTAFDRNKRPWIATDRN
jgi:hypothetical protein